MKSFGVIEGSGAPLAQEDFVKLLIAANQQRLTDAAKGLELATRANDAANLSLMSGRIALHQKSTWMLKSLLQRC